MTETSIRPNELYVYDLPGKVLNSLELLYFDSKTQENIDIKELSNSIQSPEPEVMKKADIEKDTDFYKSDFYRYNLKRSLQNLPPVAEDEFEELIERTSIESLSGSDSESTDEEEEESDERQERLETLMRRLELENGKHDEESESTVSFLNTKSAYLLFKSPHASTPDKALGIYKALFTQEQLVNSNPLEELKSFSQLKQKKSALFMIGGGHFAGAIVSHTPKNTRGNIPTAKETIHEQGVNIIVSKSFHRYTTRRKQGGSQSASDNARGKANSAGSSIRRYNEQALIQEVRELLQEWKYHLNECSSIYIRANGASNRKILVGYEGAVLQNNDSRIRGFPFTTKRATTSELKRAWVELTYLKEVDIPKTILKTEVKRNKSSSPAPVKIEKSKAQIKAEELTSELISLLKKQKAPKLISFIKQNKIDVDLFRLQPEERYSHSPTLLHYASVNSLNHMVQILMINLKSSPTVLNNAGRTPAEVASDSETRAIFQIVRHKLGESYCDWKSAKIGPAKSKEDFEKEEQERNEQVKLEKQKLIQEELAKKTEMELKKPKIQSSGSLATPGAEALNMSGLTEQQKTRIMREQRARAAEARMKMLQK
ncbi:Protein VMS1 [Spathaspora sp. JA1]|nr:Protein VMS1 [Spathaspora sp. JA1]